MTISGRRWAKIHKKTMAPLVEATGSWDEVAPATAKGSNWVASDPSAILFDRDPAHLAADLRAIWAAAGRTTLEPLAAVVQDLAGRFADEPLDDGGGDLSADVYAMH